MGSPGRTAGAPVGQPASAHIGKALRSMKKALELSPDNGLYELGLACVYEYGQVVEAGVPWQETAINHYLAAHRLTIGEDRKRYQSPLLGIQTMVSYEAANSYLRLVKQRGIKVTERGIIKEVEQNIAAREKLPRNEVITPIVLSLRSRTTLNELLAPGVQVKFDLDGTGRPQTIPGCCRRRRFWCGIPPTPAKSRLAVNYSATLRGGCFGRMAIRRWLPWTTTTTAG